MMLASALIVQRGKIFKPESLCEFSIVAMSSDAQDATS
jgi:hypothetical protein